MTRTYQRWKPDSYEWTPERVETLERMFPTATWQALRDELETTDGVILYKAGQLGLVRSISARSNGRWTDATAAEAKRLKEEKGLSASQIAKKLGPGFTRNAVIGKLSRMGITGSSETPRKASKKATKRRKANNSAWGFGRAYTAPRPKEFPLPPIEEGDVARKALVDLEPSDCRWPVGDPLKPGFGFCGLDRFPGTSYCRAHLIRAAAHPIELPERTAIPLEADSEIPSNPEMEVETAS